MPSSIDPLLVAAAVIGVWLGIALAARRSRVRIARARRRGRRGERRGLVLLEKRGYRILAREARATVRVRIDGEVEEFAVRADALARRWFRTWVVEIKSGACATLAHRATRRQLLEYACTFRCSGVLFVDSDRGTIHRVEF